MSNISMMSTRVLRPKNADLVRPLTTSRKQSSLFGRVQKRLKPKKFVFCSLAVLVTYVMCTIPLTEKQARLLLEERYRLRELITIDEGDGMCDIGSPVEDAPNHPSPNSTRTLLAAYPGSGKRFTWTIIKALTNYEVADDWNFSGKLGKNPLTIKTSWPHSEGVWTWGSDMDQVLLLMRNPRKAVPSYHTLRWELDYAKDWASCFRRIPDTYMERPPVNKWEAWRNGKAFGEIDSWFAFHDFWMQGGFVESWNMTHFRCDPNEKGYSIDCQPKQVVDFESLYSSSITDDFERIGGLLDASRDVEPIAQQARACVLHNVFNRTGHQDLNMHQASRPSPELTSEYNFTLPQYAKLMNRTIDLRDKYTEEPLASIPHADNFVRILNRYINENTNEFYDVVDNYLKDHVTKISFPGTGGDCNTLEGVEVTICNFIKYKENHGIFFDGFYPLRFPYSNWLKVSINIIVPIATIRK